MTLLDVHNLIDFYINKAQGSYLSPEEKDNMLHVWQLALYNEYQGKLGTGEGIDNSLSSFEVKLPFSTADTPDGLLTFPSTYHDIINIEARPTIAGVVRPRPVDFPNKDELTLRKGSQRIPMSEADPFAEIVGKGKVQLYPELPQSGEATYYREPIKPVFKYSLISGRIISYDSINSTQLEWGDKDVNTIVIRALSGVGINISAEDVQQWADGKILLNQTGKSKS